MLFILALLLVYLLALLLCNSFKKGSFCDVTKGTPASHRFVAVNLQIVFFFYF